MSLSSRPSTKHGTFRPRPQQISLGFESKEQHRAASAPSCRSFWFWISNAMACIYHMHKQGRKMEEWTMDGGVPCGHGGSDGGQRWVVNVASITVGDARKTPKSLVRPDGLRTRTLILAQKRPQNAQEEPRDVRERPPSKGRPLHVCVVYPTHPPPLSDQGQCCSNGPQWEQAIGLLVGASNRPCANGVDILLYTISQDLPRPSKFEKKTNMQPTWWQLRQQRRTENTLLKASPRGGEEGE